MQRTRLFWMSLLTVGAMAFGQGSAVGQGQTGGEQQAGQAGQAGVEQQQTGTPAPSGTPRESAPSPSASIQENAASGQRAGRAASDASIATGVMEKLSAAGLTPLLTVSVQNSVVTLSGYVPDDAARQRAIDLAVNAPGVTAVVPKLTVRGTQEVKPGVSAPEGTAKPSHGP